MPMKCSYTFVVRYKCVLSLLLLISYATFADNGNLGTGRNGVRCIRDGYIAGFVKVTKSYKDVSKHSLATYLVKERGIIVKSIEEFFLEHETGVAEDGTASRQHRFRSFRLEIWTLETPADANKFLRAVDEEWILGDGKPPYQYFVHKNGFFLLVSASTDSAHVIQKAVSDIIQTCFECGTIDVGATLRYVGDKEGCGKH
jgi:hypothetical protein